MSNNLRIVISAVDNATAVAKKVNTSIAQMTKPVTDLHASVAAFSKETGIDKIGRSLEKMGNSATETARRVASIAPPLTALAGLGSIAGIGALVSGFGKTGVAIANTASNLGIGTKQLQRYQGAARLAGLSSEAMTSAMESVGQKMEAAQGGWNPEAAGYLTQMGIKIHRLKNHSVDTATAIRDIAGAMSKIGGNAQARQHFLELFGLTGIQPLLDKGKGGVDQLLAMFDKSGAGMTDQQIAQAVAYNQQMVILDGTVDKLKNSLGSALAPALIQVANELIPIADEYGPKLAHWVDSIDWAKTAHEVGHFVNELGGIKTIAIAVGALTFAGPIAGAISLASQLVKIGSLLVPIAASPVMRGLLTSVAGRAAGALGLLFHSDDLNSGEDEKMKQVHASQQAIIAAGGWGSQGKPSGAGVSVSSQGAQDMFSGLESKYNLPTGLLASVYSAESANGTALVSPKGALGPFQFMPATAKQYGVTNPMDLAQSADGAARMYSDLIRQNGGNVAKALAAYNWGQGNLNRYGLGQMPAETSQYISRVLAGMGQDSPSLFRPTPAVQVADYDPSTTGAGQGKVIVEVDFKNMPRGVETRVHSHGNVQATARIGQPALLGPSV